MKMHLTQSQMLTLWRQQRLLEPIRHDAVVTRDDGIDLDAVLLPEMELWYDNLLRNGPLEQLVTHDISSNFSPKFYDDCSASITLPENVVRVINVKMSEWRHGVKPVLPGSPEAVRQAHPFTRATVHAPVAVLDDRNLRLYPANKTDSLTELTCVVRNEGEYEFMRQALAPVNPIDKDIISQLTF